MASSKEYLAFVLEQLAGLEGVTHRAMMGEYVIYYQGKVIGGIYDDRFLVKPTPSAKELLPDAPLELPYEGAKEMLLPDVDDRDLLARLLPAVAADLSNKK
jgi:TfoX/Sxy family transcriptional regulator of competence genes